MSTERTNKRLQAKGLMSQRLGGAVPSWEIKDPQRGYTLGKFSIPQPKLERIRSKSAAAQEEAAKQFSSVGESPYESYLEDNGKRIPTSNVEAFTKRADWRPNPFAKKKRKDVADMARIVPYINRLSGRISSLKKQGLMSALGPKDVEKLTGIPTTKANSRKLQLLVMSLAEHPQLLQDQNVSKFLGQAFEDLFTEKNVDARGQLSNELIQNVLEKSSLIPETKSFLHSPSDEAASAAQEAISTRELPAYKKSVGEKLESEKFKKWEAKHAPQVEEQYIEGLLGNDNEYEGKESPSYQQAQNERRRLNLDENLAAGKIPKEKAKLAKYKNPELFEAGLPQGQQTEIPERKMLQENNFDVSEIPRPKRPDLSLIVDPKKRQDALTKYNDEMTQYKHEVGSELENADAIATFNDKILTRQKALKKERQQLLAEDLFEDNLKTQKKLLKDKKKDYAKAKYEKKKRSSNLGAHDFWNAFRGGAGAGPEATGDIGGITKSIALANAAINERYKR